MQTLPTEQQQQVLRFDEMDLFEWFSLCELRNDLLTKISKLEQAL